MTIDGVDAIVNASRQPTALKIYYTGALNAPNAWGTLSGFNLGFFGAIAAKKLGVNQASSHPGIGTGIDLTTFQLLARYHL